MGPRAGLLLPGLLPVCLPWALSQNTFSRTALRVYEVTSGLSDSATPWTVARQAPRSMVFSRQEYWSGLPCPLLQGIFLTQGSNPGLLYLLHWQEGSLPPTPPGKPYLKYIRHKFLTLNSTFPLFVCVFALCVWRVCVCGEKTRSALLENFSFFFFFRFHM